MCLIQKIRYQGLRSPKNVNLHFVNDHFEGKHNADSGISGQTQITRSMYHNPDKNKVIQLKHKNILNIKFL